MANSPLTAVIQYLRQPSVVTDGGDLTDAQLMDSFIHCKDETAFQSLVSRHGPMVLAVCRRLIRNYQDAEDAFQATFLVLVRNAERIKPREMVASWLHGVAYNTALKARAIAARRQVREQQVKELPQVEATAKDLDLWLDLQPVLDQELARLPEKYRLPIILCHLEGKSIHEATHQLNWPQGTLAGRLARGRDLLAKRLARHGLMVSVGSLAVVLSQNSSSAPASDSLVSTTIEAAKQFAVEKVFPNTISSQVGILMNGGMKPMFATRLKMATALLLAVSLVGVGVGVCIGGSEVQPPVRALEPPNVGKMPNSKTDKEPRQRASGFLVAADTNILKNPGMEEGEKSPAHWTQGAEVEGVEYIWDKKNGYKSKASLCLHKTANRYFPVAQWSQTVDRTGDRPEIRVNAQVKAEKVTKATLDLIFLDDKDEWISHEWAAYVGAKNAGDPPADHEWKEYSGRVKIPKNTKKIQVGLQIYGPGKVWFDEVRAEYVE
jgi:RNA polymerase sigma-70 factor (ECF subfamily)